MTFHHITRGLSMHAFAGVTVALALDQHDQPQRFVWFVQDADGAWIACDLRAVARRAGVRLPKLFFSTYLADAWLTLGSAAVRFVAEVGVPIAVVEEQPRAPAPAPAASGPPAWWNRD